MVETLGPLELPPQTWHHPRRHAAVRTDEYVYSQLIPYIGNKRKLLPLIARGILSTGLSAGSFVDLFSGSSVVARFAKTLGFRIIANDWEPYAYEIAQGTVVLNAPPPLAKLGGAKAVFAHLNHLAPLHGYVAEHLCPYDDEHPDLARERLFFTRQNGERIDAVREQIATWDVQGQLDGDERAFLLSALVYAVSYVSNTSGVFKGFHAGWGGQTGTALYRIRSLLTLRPPVTFDNQQPNLAFRRDAQLVGRELREVIGDVPEIVYLDPPYNQHPYGSNYHVLNTVVLWDKPPLNPWIQHDGPNRDKSAIRTDWRSERRSLYNGPRTALAAFRLLVGNLDARWILASYSTDGTMPLEGVLSALAERGDLRVFTQKYKRYRVSTPRMSTKPHTTEFLAVVDTSAPPSLDRVDCMVEDIVSLAGDESGGQFSPKTESL
ncbi:MAG TPA: DNA adenine methylase [Chloroflexota bacterium]|nr:DNA adenine methylase [Chloroflexota bacterium]